MKWLELNYAHKIPEDWDKLAGDSIFLRKDFLHHLEQVNPCNQSYNLLVDKGSVKALYVDYNFKLDIFTYSKWSLKIPVRIMGIPCSVSKQGFVVQKDYEGMLLQHFHNKKGAKLVLNAETNLPGRKGETLLTCRLNIKWESFNEYLNTMRSHYRYRIKKARDKWENVKINILQPRDFNQELYRLYCNVYERSQAKLEKQHLSFFQNMPFPAKIITATYDHKVLGFVMLIENGEELIFLFTGFDYHLNYRFFTYQNLLLEIVGYAIDNKFKIIDFGQTAEETKLKLGCHLKQRHMYISHSNPLIHWVANKNIDLLGYKIPEYHFQVFRNEEPI